MAVALSFCARSCLLLQAQTEHRFIYLLTLSGVQFFHLHYKEKAPNAVLMVAFIGCLPVHRVLGAAQQIYTWAYA